MVSRIFVEKKDGFNSEAMSRRYDIRHLLGIKNLENIRVINRYDVENISEELFSYAVKTVFSEPQLDNIYTSLEDNSDCSFAVEYLPGQFDQRADSASQCIQIISQGERPLVSTAKIYMLYGKLSETETAEIEKYLINPVEARKASFEAKETLKTEFTIPEQVEILEGFNELKKDEISAFVKKYALAMDDDDLSFCQEYFRSEKRNPTITEIRMLDTYWSDHCRHTTFLTTIDSVKFEDSAIEKTYNDYISMRKALGRTKPVNLMDIGTIAAKYLKKTGQLDKLDESDEINACTVKIEIECDGKKEPWLLLFKNETHNHPTEIEPFGGAATCIGGAIRDPLSGRAYVYGAMRITGAANPLKKVSETIKGKLPQRKIVTTAAAGYSSYGNQIGLATGIVDEIYHDGYAAKHLEIGAVIAATPQANVRRECPVDGDVIILLGGKTGRDGCGGATGSSKSHTSASLESCGAEVQKGNAPEERKLQRLFRNAEAVKLIKRCNDFGAGGVSVAIGEIADGLEINLNAVPKKYEGLDGTELAISESQERMAVAVAKEDADTFTALANAENIEATVVARVKAERRLTMTWNGKTIVDISRDFLDSNGAEKHTECAPEKAKDYSKTVSGTFTENIKAMAGELNICSKRGLSERFDSTIGAGTVLMPFGGKYQLTPIQCMVQKISCEKKHTDACSYMSWGYNPDITEKSPYHGAYLAVAESLCKLICAGAEFKDVYLTFQEYFPKPNRDAARWGQPLAALLGALRAQKEFGTAAIGGKDSMSGSFEKLDVPPTLVSFAVTSGKTDDVISNEFKSAGNPVYIISPKQNSDGLPDSASLIEIFSRVTSLIRSKKAVSVYTPSVGGIAEAVMKMCLGNMLGFTYESSYSLQRLFGYSYGSFILECTEDIADAQKLGVVSAEGVISLGAQAVSLTDVLDIYEDKLESVYHLKSASQQGSTTESFSFTADVRRSPLIKTAVPKVLIPVFPGTNCEYDSQKVMLDAGAEAEIFVINNLSASSIAKSAENFAKSVQNSQIIFVPGGFSGGDEPDGSGKFITAFFRNEAVKEAVTSLLDERDGLMLGICNGFQALIKLGLVPYGKIIDTDEGCPTLTYNTIGRHQSRMAKIRVSSNKSPWLSLTETGDIFNVPISHGEGRFIADEALLKQLAENGQIATQYVDFNGNASMDILFNPNNSMFAVEGITSPDGRVFGKMGHAERIGKGLYKNIYGETDMKMFSAAVKYFK